MMFFRVVKYCIYGLLLGLLGSIYFFQNEEFIKKTLESYIKKEFSTTFDCSMECRLVAINLFKPGLEFADIVIRPHVGSAWKWEAKKFYISCHWLYMLYNRALDSDIMLDEFRGYSEIDQGKCALIEDHFKKLLFGSPLDVPLVPQTIICNNSSLFLHDKKSDIKGEFFCNCAIKNRRNIYETAAEIVDGHIWNSATTHVRNAQVRIQAKVSLIDDNLEGAFDADFSWKLPSLAHDTMRYHINGEWHADKGTFHVKNDHENCIVSPISVAQQSSGAFLITAQAKLSLQEMFAEWLPFLSNVCPSSCSLVAEAYIDDKDIKFKTQGELEAQEKQAERITGDFRCSKEGALCSGALRLKLPHDLSTESTVRWNMDTGQGLLETSCKQKKNAEALLKLDKPALLTCNFDERGFARGSFKVPLAVNQEAILLEGIFKKNDNALKVQGNCGQKKYTADFQILPNFLVRKFTLDDKENLITATSASPMTLQSSISMGYIKELLGNPFGLTIAHEGKLNLTIGLQNPFALHIDLIDGAFRLPHIYNVLHGISGDITFNYVEKEIMLKNLRCSLYKGAIDCSRAVIRFDDQYKLSFAHVPVVVNGCLLNLNKDVFAIVSGSFLGTYDGKNLPTLKGKCIIDNAQVKQNIFSTQFQRLVFRQLPEIDLDTKNSDLICDVFLTTFNPIYIKTAFLETAAKVDIHLEGTIHKPKISGGINLVSGSLLFPYKPLHIVKGSLNVNPLDITDPHIELVAKNSIKKHAIDLHVAGSLNNPQVMLFSAPSLTQDQIIALLFTGSEQGSLSTTMPILLMNGLTALLFAQDQSPRAIDGYFKNLFKPFKSIHLVPSLNDQTGRGGLRGAIEIEVNDRLHALIQKNFSLTEDTRFELEYLLSDEISLKAFRDERRDVGGEVEMKWKF